MTKASTPRRKAGQCLTWDFQADDCGGAYSLVERVGPNRWLAVRLPPSEAEVAAELTAPYHRDHAAAKAAVDRRWAAWGTTFEVQFSRDYHKHF